MSGQLQFKNPCSPAHEKLLRHVHNCCKHQDEEVASSKKNEFKTRVQNSIPYLLPKIYGGKMAKIDTRFMTKAAEKPYPLGPHIQQN